MHWVCQSVLCTLTVAHVILVVLAWIITISFLLAMMFQMLAVALRKLVPLLPCYIAQVTTIFSTRSDALTCSCKLILHMLLSAIKFYIIASQSRKNYNLDLPKSLYQDANCFMVFIRIFCLPLLLTVSCQSHCNTPSLCEGAPLSRCHQIWKLISQNAQYRNQVLWTVGDGSTLVPEVKYCDWW